MTALTRSLLAIAVVCLVAGLLISIGLIDVGSEAGWYVILPTGAIFLGLFMLSRIFEEEAAQYDQEQRPRLSARQTGGETQTVPSAKGCDHESEPKPAHEFTPV